MSPLKETIDGTLENWKFFPLPNGRRKVVGDLYGDTKGRFYEGEYVTTSVVKGYDRNRGIIRTRNSVYALGTPAGQPPQVAEGEKLIAEVRWPSAAMAGGHPLGAIYYGNDQVDLGRVRDNGPQGLMQENLNSPKDRLRACYDALQEELFEVVGKVPESVWFKMEAMDQLIDQLPD